MMEAELDQAKWTAKERMELLDRGFRTRREGEIPCNAVVRPTDYEHDLKRGTIEFMPAWRNYSMHTVVIPDGTTLKGCNFAQAAPNTPAIIGSDLTLVECNLVNCRVDPSWTLDCCNTVQSWIVKDAEGKEDREYICGHPDALKGDEKEPVNAVLARAY